MFIPRRIPRIIFKFSRIPRVNSNIIIPKQSSSPFSLFHHHKSYKNHKGNLKDFGKFNSNNNSKLLLFTFILVGSTTAVTAAEIYKNKNKFILLEESSNYSPPNYEETTAYELLSQPVVIALRIEPVRNTNGQHLRDGFTRTLTNRLQNEHHLNEFEIEQILEAIKEFKSKFPKTSIKAGTSMILTKQKDGNLRMEYEGKYYGTIENLWIAKNLFMGYLTSNNPISKE
ncbi:8555_t:CDS:2, partial [Diversispora eburnea]